MNKHKKRVFSLVLALAIMASTMFGNVSYSYASGETADSTVSVQATQEASTDTAAGQEKSEASGEAGAADSGQEAPASEPAVQKGQDTMAGTDNGEPKQDALAGEITTETAAEAPADTEEISTGNSANEGSAKAEQETAAEEVPGKTEQETATEEAPGKTGQETATEEAPGETGQETATEEASGKSEQNAQKDISIVETKKETNTVTHAQSTPDAVSGATIDQNSFTPVSDVLNAADTGDYTVKGVVTLIDGSNIYVQDSTGGICVRMSTAPADISLGDTILGRGTRSTYYGMKQLKNSSYIKATDKVELKAADKTLDQLTEADVGTYVQLKDLEITKISGNNITLSDGTTSLNLYKGVLNTSDGKTLALAKGDIIQLKAAVNIYNGKIRLMNTTGDEITITNKGSQSGSDTQTNPTDSQTTISKISEVYNGKDGDSYTVKGVVTLVDGKNIYIQDESKAICLYMTKTPSSIKLGDVIQGTGVKSVYNTVIQLKDATYNKLNEKMELKAVEKASLKDIVKDDVYSYIEIKNLTVEKEGTNYYLTDAAGDRVQFYKPALEKSDKSMVELTAGSVINLKGAVGYYKSVQLRNTTGDEITVVKQEAAKPDVTLPTGVDNKVVIYNVGAKGVLAGQDDNVSKPNVNSADSTLENGKVTAGNGGVVFSLETNGAYYRFYNESYGYLYSNGTGGNAGYITKENLAKETDQKIVDWEVINSNGNYLLKSLGAVYKGNAQYLEYYDNSYKTYSYSTKGNTEIYQFNFYPYTNTKLVEDVVNEPTVVRSSEEDAYIGVEYKFSYTLDVPFGVKELKVSLKQEELIPTEELGIYSVVVPKEKVTGESLEFVFVGKDNKDIDINTTIKVPVLDEPIIEKVSPEPGSEMGDNKKPLITADAINTGKAPVITMLVNEKEVKAEFKDGKISYQPAEDFANGRISVSITLKREDGKETSKSWSFYVGPKTERLYFGQLHSHTAEYSDGSGTLQEALDYIGSLPESANVDFVAFTDHSNYFDNEGGANPEGALYDMGLASDYARNKWSSYQNTIRAFNEKQGNVVALPGFEMTWSGGPGHINTFNTPGIVSRNNTTLNSKTDHAGMKAYYALLSQEEGKDSISQFNHPGDTFGTFGDFAFWNPVIDQRMRMVEVGNGEGAIGSGGYFPSYEYYIMALDKGWHVAPTNNQDNHKGRWGNANEARDVVLTDNFTEQGVYQAIRDLRMYSTEDKNLEILYTVNGAKLGSNIIEVPAKLDVNVSVYDPDSTDKIQKVEVVVNSGKVVHIWDNETELSKGELSCTLTPEYSYYFIRVTQKDGNLAVTAPVWVGEHIKLGISSLTSKTDIPVTGEELTLTASFFNGQDTEAKVKSITYTINGSQVIGNDTTGYAIPASGTAEAQFKYVPEKAKVEKIVATAVMELKGKEFTFTAEITLDIQASEKLSYIGIDAAHYNEYVAGNYKDSMGNFTKLAIPYALRTTQLNDSAALISACDNPKFKALILTAPSRRLAASHTDPRVYSQDELAALKRFHDRGGMIILAGWSDHYENPSKTDNNTGQPFVHMAQTQNEILKTLGSSLRISDDATYDKQYNGGQEYRLYFNTYGDNFLTNGVVIDKDNLFSDLHTQQFSHYGGASIYAVDAQGNPVSTLPSTVSPVVFGHSSTYSVDADEDGNANGLGADAVPKYTSPAGDQRLLIMAYEQIEGKGTIIVSGAAFMSNFEVKAELDNNSQLNYANYKICENLVEHLNPMAISKIQEVQQQKEEGIKYVVEGVVTSNASGFDKDTAFFDCIYLQDETGGINCFPVAGNYQIGDRLRIVGTTSSYQGERQLSVSSVKKLGTADPIQPKKITASQLNDGSVLGQLVEISGVITQVEKENGLIQTIMVKDSQGNIARIFIDGYITSATEVVGAQQGAKITAVGLASYDNTFKAPNGPFPRIRVKDRADIVCSPGEVTPQTPPQTPQTPQTPQAGGTGDTASTPSAPETGGSGSASQPIGGAGSTVTPAKQGQEAKTQIPTMQQENAPNTNAGLSQGMRGRQTASTAGRRTESAEKEAEIAVLPIPGQEGSKVKIRDDSNKEYMLVSELYEEKELSQLKSLLESFVEKVEGLEHITNNFGSENTVIMDIYLADEQGIEVRDIKGTVKFLIPYPAGCKMEYLINVVHVVGGKTPILLQENADYTKTEQGILLEVDSFSPFIITWEEASAENLEVSAKEEEAAVPVSNDNEPTVDTAEVVKEENSMLSIIIVICIILIAGAAAGYYYYIRRKKS